MAIEVKTTALFSSEAEVIRAHHAAERSGSHIKLLSNCGTEAIYAAAVAYGRSLGRGRDIDPLPRQRQADDVMRRGGAVVYLTMLIDPNAEMKGWEDAPFWQAYDRLGTESQSE